MISKTISTGETLEYHPEIYLTAVIVAESDSEVCPICGEETVGRFVNLAKYQGCVGSKLVGHIKPYVYFCDCCSRYSLHPSEAKVIASSLTDTHFKIVDSEDSALCKSSNSISSTPMTHDLVTHTEVVAVLMSATAQLSAESELHRIGYNVTNKTISERHNILRIAVGRLGRDKVISHLLWLIDFRSKQHKNNNALCIGRWTNDIEWVQENL